MEHCRARVVRRRPASVVRPLFCSFAKALVLSIELPARFILVLIPAGPSAMLLVSVAELVNVDQGPIAGYLTISVRALLR